MFYYRICPVSLANKGFQAISKHLTPGGSFYVWRACYTMECEPRYCDLTIDRWQNLTGKGTKKNAD